MMHSKNLIWLNQNPWNSKKIHIYCARRNFCNILLNLQGNHKPHCLRKKKNIRGYKTYSTTLPSHPTPPPLLWNQMQNSYLKVPFLFFFCDFVYFWNIKSLKQPTSPTHTHICSSQSEMQNSYSRHPFFSIVIFLYWRE